MFCYFFLYQLVQVLVLGVIKGFVVIGLFRVMIFDVKFDNVDQFQFKGLEWITVINDYRLNFNFG